MPPTSTVYIVPVETGSADTSSTPHIPGAGAAVDSVNLQMIVRGRLVEPADLLLRFPVHLRGFVPRSGYRVHDGLCGFAYRPATLFTPETTVFTTVSPRIAVATVFTAFPMPLTTF